MLHYSLRFSFDISGWEESTSHYQTITHSEDKTITLFFDGARSFDFSWPQFWYCGEIKFDNLHGRENLYQDWDPSSIKECPRPYSRFFIVGDATVMVVHFNEEDCSISAWFGD